LAFKTASVQSRAGTATPGAIPPAQEIRYKHPASFTGFFVRRTFAIASATLCLLVLGTAQAGGSKSGKTGLKLPRFASLKAAEVNLRTGPGTRYPVEWVLTYRNMPVEIVGEFDGWRKVRDWKGSVGWVHRSMLSGRRWAMVRKGIQPLRRAPDPAAPLVARIEPKAIGRVLECRKSWCRMDFSGFEGWMRRAQFWGVYPQEVID